MQKNEGNTRSAKSINDTTYQNESGQRFYRKTEKEEQELKLREDNSFIKQNKNKSNKNKQKNNKTHRCWKRSEHGIEIGERMKKRGLRQGFVRDRKKRERQGGRIVLLGSKKR